MLSVGHSFLQPKYYIRLLTCDQKEAEPSTKPFTVDEGGIPPTSNNMVCMKEMAYVTDSSAITPVCTKYRVNDLGGLTQLLASGVDIVLSIRRLMYSKKDELGESVTSKGEKGRKAAATNASKSGGNSGSSRQPSRASSRVS